MTNMAGQGLQNQPVTIINSVMSLNVSRLPSGTYVLRAVLNDVSYHITVVIAR
jgi:large repetitive protein